MSVSLLSSDGCIFWHPYWPTVLNTQNYVTAHVHAEGRAVMFGPNREILREPT